MSTILEKCNAINIEKKAKITPENIRKGVDIFGVVGNGNMVDAKITNVTNLFTNNYRNDCLQDLLSLCTDITNANKMFYKCNLLQSLDLSGFNTSNITDMGSMFYECKGLKTLNLGDFNTSKVTDMSGMFYYCENLTNIDLSKFSTLSVTNMSEMFRECGSLLELDVAGFDTSNVTDMSYMFYSCENITTLDVTGFDTSKVTDMSRMFSDCRKLTELDLTNFDTSNVTNMYGMFESCQSIKSFNLSNFNTSKVTSVEGMFGSCWDLTELDLSNLDFSSVTKAGSIIYSNPYSHITDFKSFTNLGKAYTAKQTNNYYYKVNFSTCTRFTHDSLMSIINNLYDLNLSYDVANGGTLYAQQLILGSTNLANLTAEEISIATNKGWTVS